ncbi:hypothetical protein SAMN06297280_3404 [Arsukibacterium tuosuense]|uniref:Uncharacterized protein n=1 Tax=Arsukibacterium tuosuense TaxID=1323745 RepID=A0A285JDU4_9GAMM|nr:hypothetical protein [Arsukibacterium tuosuense]SNY58444.1 hypothetical protein SAMN06297280_3404 [Arsukibacterium tuosuense]
MKHALSFKHLEALPELYQLAAFAQGLSTPASDLKYAVGKSCSS